MSAMESNSPKNQLKKEPINLSTTQEIQMVEDLPKAEGDSSSTSTNNMDQPIKRRVLIPLDGSKNSKEAFKWYIRQMLLPKDEVIFLEVITPQLSHSSFNGFSFALLKEELDNISGVTQQRLVHGKALAQKYKARALHHGATRTRAYLHLHLQPGEAIVEAIKTYDIDLVVMGSRGLGKIRRTFLGSVSDFVLHHAHIPITIVPLSVAESTS